MILVLHYKVHDVAKGEGGDLNYTTPKSKLKITEKKKNYTDKRDPQPDQFTSLPKVILYNNSSNLFI